MADSKGRENRSERAKRNEALEEALRELGRDETPEELLRRGVRRVRSVPKGLVAKVVEQAVNRSILERTVGLPEEERERVVASAHRQLDGLLHMKDRVEEARARVNRALEDDAFPERRANGSGATDERVDLLERRIAKLRAALEHAEGVLVQVLSDIDTGVPSAFRYIEGLSPDDPLHDVKREILDRLSDVNRDAQRPR